MGTIPVYFQLSLVHNVGGTVSTHHVHLYGTWCSLPEANPRWLEVGYSIYSDYLPDGLWATHTWSRLLQIRSVVISCLMIVSRTHSVTAHRSCCSWRPFLWPCAAFWNYSQWKDWQWRQTRLKGTNVLPTPRSPHEDREPATLYTP